MYETQAPLRPPTNLSEGGGRFRLHSVNGNKKTGTRRSECPSVAMRQIAVIAEKLRRPSRLRRLPSLTLPDAFRARPSSWP